MARRIKGKAQARKIRKLVNNSQNKGGNFVQVIFGVFALVFLLGSLAFFSTSITGNAIGAGSQVSANLVGVYLFIWGLISGVAFLKENK